MRSINAILRRSKAMSSSGTPKSEILVDVLYLNRIQQVTKYHAKLLEFTPIQFKLLWMLVENKGETLSKAFLYHSVLNKPFSRYDRSLDMHLSRVRKKLVETGMPPERLATVHGQGYRFSWRINCFGVYAHLLLWVLSYYSGRLRGLLIIPKPAWAF